MSTVDSKKKLSVCTFYCYHKLKKMNLKSLGHILVQKGRSNGIRGLIILSHEGINATLTGPLFDLKRYLKNIEHQMGVSIQGKWQKCDSWNFKNIHLKIRKEIVQSGKQNLSVPPKKTHLTPEQWEEMIKEKNSLIIDIRNSYETKLGRFRKAKDLQLEEFKQFPQQLRKHNFPKDKNTFIYCTGGIRCEKALSEMRNQGFKKIFQLSGGIVNYLSYFPHSQFEGECFVFDHRVSLDQNLSPSEIYKLCPHCGQSGKKNIICAHCQNSCVVCNICYKKKPHFRTCSKNCAYHHQKGHLYKKKTHKKNQS